MKYEKPKSTQYIDICNDFNDIDTLYILHMCMTLSLSRYLSLSLSLDIYIYMYVCVYINIYIISIYTREREREAVEMFRKWAATSVKRPRPLFICSREKSLGPALVDEQSSGKTTRYGNSLPKIIIMGIYRIW